MNHNDAERLRQLISTHDHEAVRDYASQFNGSTDLLILGELPLDLAKRLGCDDCYEILIECGADPSREAITKRMDWYAWDQVRDQVVMDFKENVITIPRFISVARDFILSNEWNNSFEKKFQAFQFQAFVPKKQSYEVDVDHSQQNFQRMAKLNHRTAEELRNMMTGQVHDHGAIRDYARKFTTSTDLLFLGQSPWDVAKTSGCKECLEIFGVESTQMSDPHNKIEYEQTRHEKISKQSSLFISLE
jgi:hypothetical protein